MQANLKLYIFLIFFFSFQQVVFADRVLNALSQLQKGEFEKARELLDKHLEKEPKNSAGAFHVFAIYFFTEKNPLYQIDSAHFFIQKALENYPQANPKDTADWAKKGISYKTALKLRSEIELQAYKFALNGNSVNEMQEFIRKYLLASEIPKAIERRNELAWEETLKENSLEAYLYFIQNYPDAVQVPQAIQKRDRIIIDRQTKSGKLNDIENFISQYSDNQYINEAIEKIYYLKSYHHSPKTYQDFIQKYPNVKINQKAWDWLLAFHLKNNDLKGFLSQYPNYYQQTYLEKLIPNEGLTYFPFYDNEAYGYLDETGKVQIHNDLENIPKNHLCETSQQNYLIYQKNNHLGLLDRIGKVLIEPIYDKLELLTLGVYRVTKNAQQGLIHQAGWEILPARYDLIEILNQNLLKIRKNRRWGIATMNGTVIFEPQFSDIEAYSHDFVVFRMNEKYGVLTNDELFGLFAYKLGGVKLDYNKLEKVDSLYVQFEKNDSLGVMDKTGQIILPLDNQQISYIPALAWAVKKNQAWEIYNLKGENLLPEQKFEKFIFNEKYNGLKKDTKWGIVDAKGLLIRPFEFDSLAFVGEMTLLYHKKKVNAEFLQHPSIKHIDFTHFKNIRIEKAESGHSQTFIYFEDNLRRKNLYSSTGNKLFTAPVTNVYVLDNELINFQLNGKYGLVDTTGKTILPAKYDGISNLWKDYKTLLNNGKYGLFHKNQQILLEPNYEEVPRFWGDSTQNYRFLAKKNGYFGVVDMKNKNVLAFDFQAIEYWQDSTALVQDKKGKWAFFNFSKAKNKKVDTLKISFDEVKIIKRTPQETIALVKQNGLYGFWSNQRNEIISPQFENVSNLGKTGKAFFFAERKKERNRYEITYLNQQAEIIWRKEMSELDYYKIICE